MFGNSIILYHLKFCCCSNPCQKQNVHTVLWHSLKDTDVSPTSLQEQQPRPSLGDDERMILWGRRDTPWELHLHAKSDAPRVLHRFLSHILPACPLQGYIP